MIINSRLPPWLLSFSHVEALNKGWFLVATEMAWELQESYNLIKIKMIEASDYVPLKIASFN